MTTETQDIESTALRRIDHARSAVLRWIAATAVVEAGLLIAFIALADFSNRTHLLLLIGCLLIYATLGLGLIALAAFTRWWALRIIAATESLARPTPG